jgi:hypothetical protein
MRSGCLPTRATPRPARSAPAGAVAVVMLALLAVAGCSQANSTRLPELASLPRRLLSDEEQKKAVEELKARQAAHRAEAVKEIEQARIRQGGN